MSKIQHEKEVITAMISLYCRRHHGAVKMCRCCAELLDYALRRLDRCREGELKTSCRRCPHHCYAPSRREEIKEVMRWAGPRMIWSHPLTTLRHLFD